MDIRHPGLYVQQELTKRGRTQKGFAHILGKKVSEVNELIKGKRNITVQRDILLSTVFDTKPQKWITLQMEYDYQGGSQSVDQEKIEEIKVRKSLLEEKDGGWKHGNMEELKSDDIEVESGVVESGELKIEDGELKIEDGELMIEEKEVKIPEQSDTTLPVASEEEETTIQATEEPKKDKKKEHEIFRNF